MKTIKVSWTQYHKLVDNLAEQIKKSGKVYKAVYSPDNPMLAFLLSKKLEMQLHKHWSSMNSIYKMSFIDKEYLKCMDPETTLVVSDIINTGNTREKYKYFDFACLYFNTKGGRLTEPNYLHSISTRVKTYWLKTIDNEGTKVIMPWEKEIKQ